jgi:CDP-glycerol glycerophosphotransferase (TagB/SpsB family)/glycosyltransferase involved in cell wall biosynthesis
MSVKISVIIPVYNAEEYLRETLNNVLNQTLDEYEVITVNDGSVDASSTILKEFSEQYPNLRVINQKNAGPSAARNAALDQAQGEYVYFMDSDDSLNSSSLKLLYNRAKERNADLVIARYDIFNSYSKNRVTNINKLTGQDVIDKYDTDILWTFSLWNKLFRREVIEENHFRFPPVSYSEDGVFSMRFVYAAKRITGLPRVVYHYRRENEATSTSITAKATMSKVHDYIQAHDWIYDAMEESILKEYDTYSDIDELIQNEESVRAYVDQFLKKEVTILINQFYKKFWDLDEELIAYLAGEIEKKLAKADKWVYYSLLDTHHELQLHNLFVNYQQAVENAKVTVLLYGKPEEEEQFVVSLTNLCSQNMIPYIIVVPENMRNVVEQNGIANYNIQYLNEDNQQRFWNEGLRQCVTPYIVFSDYRFSYASWAIKEMYIACDTGRYDFATYVIYYADSPRNISIFFDMKALLNEQDYRALGEQGKYELFLQNKIFSVGFLRENHIQITTPFGDVCKKIYDTGFYMASIRKHIAFHGSVQDFLSEVLDEASDAANLKEDISNLTLGDKRLETDLREVSVVVPPTKAKGKKGFFQRGILKLVSRLPIKNRTLIVSVRKDGELEGNAKALADKIEGETLICAKQLPHDQLYKLKMYYYVATSKVIVTDDYLRYLRIFPLKPEQKVVQLWHACGVFKKFGVQGTTLSHKVDKSTHAQYNLVCVSSEGIRPYYSEAFQINMSRVQALGTPRTDIFFDKDAIAKKQELVYACHPELKDKKVILYAPTFRDHTGDRSVFEPQIDFDRLSQTLGKNQVFVICPHPIMLNDILPGKYDNIEVIRDVSTNDIMFVSDMMVTDYSSVIFEYALLRKPIVFYCYDREFYDRGFYLDYNTDLPGEIIEEFDDFLLYLQDESRQVVSEQYENFLERYMSACDGHSSERIAQLINEYVKG